MEAPRPVEESDVSAGGAHEADIARPRIAARHVKAHPPAGNIRMDDERPCPRGAGGRGAAGMNGDPRIRQGHDLSNRKRASDGDVDGATGQDGARPRRQRRGDRELKAALLAGRGRRAIAFGVLVFIRLIGPARECRAGERPLTPDLLGTAARRGATGALRREAAHRVVGGASRASAKAERVLAGPAAREEVSTVAEGPAGLADNRAHEAVGKRRRLQGFRRQLGSQGPFIPEARGRERQEDTQ